MRLFVAIPLPQVVRDGVASVQDRLRRAQADVSWVKAANLHITLKFLGETEPTRLERIGLALAEVARGAAPFALTVAGVGTFGGRIPRVVWVGVGDGAVPLEALAGAVENGLAPLGFPKERRGFTAHFTLGRVRSSRNVEDLRAAIRDEPARPLGTVRVEEFVLIHSRLDPGGSIYTALMHFPLGRA